MNLFSPLVFHNLIPLSAPAEMIYLLSGENEQVNTSLVCPVNRLFVLHVFKSHSLIVLSHDEEIRKLLSLDNDISEMK
jgi:hypothetical protein